MLTINDIEQFYNDVSALGLKFPVAAISKATGFSKGNVSDYLSRKKEPSENFVKVFYKKLYKGSTDVPRNTVSAGNSHVRGTGQVDLVVEETSATYRHKGAGKGEGLKSSVNGLQDPYREKYITLLEKENDRKSHIIETNLTGLVIGQKSILAHLAVSLECDAMRDGGGDKRKADRIKENMDKRIGEVFSGKVRKDKTSGKMSSGK